MSNSARRSCASWLVALNLAPVLPACGSSPAPATKVVTSTSTTSAASTSALLLASNVSHDPSSVTQSNGAPSTALGTRGNDPEGVVGTSEEPAPFVVGPATLRLGNRPPWSEPRSRMRAVQSAPSQWRLEKTISVGKGYLYKAAFSRDEQSVFVLSQQDGVFRQYALKTGHLLQQVPLNDFKEFEAVDFAPHTHENVFIIRDQGLSTLNLSTGKIITVLGLDGGDQIEELAPPGLFALSNRRIEPQSGTVTLVWMDGGAPTEALRILSDERPDGVALSSDGRYLALNVYPSNYVYLTDLVARRLVHRLSPPQWGASVAFSPDGQLLALGGAELHVHDTTTGALVARDTGYGNNIGNLRFTPQGDLLLTSAFDGKARSYVLGSTPIRDLRTPQTLRHRGSANVYGLGLAHDGRKLATSSGDTTVKIWAR